MAEPDNDLGAIHEIADEEAQQLGIPKAWGKQKSQLVVGLLSALLSGWLSGKVTGKPVFPGFSSLLTTMTTEYIKKKRNASKGRAQLSNKSLLRPVVGLRCQGLSGRPPPCWAFDFSLPND